MARYVTKYEAKDGRLFDTEREADCWDARAQILRLILGTWGATGHQEEVATWIAEHLKDLSDIARWPTIANQTVDEILGIKPIESEVPPDISREVCDAVRAEQP
jgi:hypothetical protein